MSFQDTMPLPLSSAFIRYIFLLLRSPCPSFKLAVQLAALRSLIEQKFPDATPIARRTVRPVATGIPELDHALPRGGLPLGKLSACAPGGGATSVLRAACETTLAGGDRAAWIDGAGVVAGASWKQGPLLVRPRGARQAAQAADLLLRCGGFRLVVLALGKPDALADADTVRLVRAAHEGGGAFVVLGGRTRGPSMAALRLSTRIAPDGWRWRDDPFGEPAEVHDVRLSAEVRALGWHKHATFTLPVESHELRLSLDTGLADRRGGPTRPGTATSGNRRTRRRVDSPGTGPAAPVVRPRAS